MLNVFVAAIVLLILAWTALVAPSLATMIKSQLLSDFLNSSWVSSGAVYALTASVIALQLFAIHLWLAAGRRRLADVWPGIVVTILLWMLLGTAYSYYLGFSNYSRFYAGLSQIMIALIFFQVTAVAIILGAELNRGLIELKKMRNGNGSLL